MEELLGKEKYFVYKGTWKNDYEWRIKKVHIKGVKLDEKGTLYVEFSFSSCGYEYPASYLKDTLEEAKELALKEIMKEKTEQTKTIKNWIEANCL